MNRLPRSRSGSRSARTRCSNAYNEEDCRSLYELHRWLLGQRPAGLEWRPPPEQREPSEESAEKLAERGTVRQRLLAGAVEGDSRWSLAQLLDYHRREEKPQWWEYFHTASSTPRSCSRTRTRSAASSSSRRKRTANPGQFALADALAVGTAARNVILLGDPN